jgi:hypothetical protein
VCGLLELGNCHILLLMYVIAYAVAVRTLLCKYALLRHQAELLSLDCYIRTMVPWGG